MREWVFYRLSAQNEEIFFRWFCDKLLNNSPDLVPKLSVKKQKVAEVSAKISKESSDWFSKLANLDASMSAQKAGETFRQLSKDWVKNTEVQKFVKKMLGEIR